MTARVVTVPAGPSSDVQSRKFGLWAGERMQAAAWRLRPGQQIVPHMHPNADGMIVVLAGHGDFLVFDEEEPNPDMCYVPSPEKVIVGPTEGSIGEPSRRPIGPGSVGFAVAGVFYGLDNTGSDQLVAVAVTAPDVDSTVWAARVH
jgi:oxalate decarboxylase/phosphoglucose isomerase-like protein (cupin superfamily)